MVSGDGDGDDGDGGKQLPAVNVFRHNVMFAVLKGRLPLVDLRLHACHKERISLADIVKLDQCRKVN